MSGRHGHSHAGAATPIGLRVRWLLAAALAVFALVTLVGLGLLWPSHHQRALPAAGTGRVTYLPGVIVRVTAQPCSNAVGGGTGSCLLLDVRLTGGEGGPVVSLTVGASDPAPFHTGRQVRLGRLVDPATGAASYFFDDLVRDLPLAWLAGIFAVVVVAIARWRGVAALAGLLVTYLVLVLFLLPALEDGSSPVAVGFTGAAAIVFAVLYLAHGISARTSVALLGTLLSLALTGLGGWLAVDSARLTQLSSDATPYLQASTSAVSASGLVLCGLIIGTLGVLNDATVTQAAAVWELHAADPALPLARLYGSALRIGRDHIASTIYTLVLAYAGSALPVLLLFSLSGRSAHDVLTGDEIAGEIVRGLVGGIGIALSVPLTTAIAALVVTAGRRAAPRDTGQPATWMDRRT
jgi:uncharacterized membrane protein